MKKQYNKPVVTHYITEQALQELVEREKAVRIEEENVKELKARIKRAWNVAVEQSKLNDQFHEDLLAYSSELLNLEEELFEEECRQKKHEYLNIFISAAAVLTTGINLILLWGFLG